MAKKIEAVVGNNVIATDVPDYGSDKWDAYVMSLFTEDELIDGKPRCVGLRRVARLVLGETLSSIPIHVSPATDVDGPGRATVVYQIEFQWFDGTVRRFGDVADVWHGNTDDMFAAHPAACASTKAEARTLRKALLIKAVAAEELTVKDTAAIVKRSVKVEAPTTGEVNDDDKMSVAQRNFISLKCKQLGVNVLQLADNSDPSSWTKKFASNLITKINSLQQSGVVTESGYDNNWAS